MSFFNLAGKFSQAIGTAGTVTVPAGAVVLRIYAQSTAGGTLAIFGGTALPIIATQAPINLDYRHLLLVSGKGTNTKDIVFTTTTAYLVEYVELGKG